MRRRLGLNQIWEWENKFKEKAFKTFDNAKVQGPFINNVTMQDLSTGVIIWMDTKGAFINDISQIGGWGKLRQLNWLRFKVWLIFYYPFLICCHILHLLNPIQFKLKISKNLNPYFFSIFEHFQYIMTIFNWFNHFCQILWLNYSFSSMFWWILAIFDVLINIVIKTVLI